MTAALRTLGIGLVVVGIMVTATGTGAISSVATTHDQQIAVVDDAGAYLGYRSPASLNVTDGEIHPIVTLTNRYWTPVRVESVDADTPAELELTVRERPHLAIGERRPILAEFACDERLSDEPVHVTLTTSGEALSVTILGDHPSRTIAISCHPDT